MYRFTDGRNYLKHAIGNFKNFLLPMKDKDEPLRFLELGVAEGRSSVWMLDNLLTHPDSSLDCVDVNEWKNTKHNLKDRIDLGKCRFFLEHTHTALAKLLCQEIQYDFIYIDAHHASSSVIQDAAMSFPMLKSGGIMAFDDYGWFDPKQAKTIIDTPRPAINFFLASFSDQIEVIHKNFQVWIKKH